MDSIQQLFADRLQEHGIILNELQLEQFETYFKELVNWNEKMNLTGITERDQVYTKHFYDSVSLSFYMEMEHIKTLADIGSGAGFPGIPLKICFPEIQLTIIDSLNKRITFLKNIVEKLNLAGVELIHGRAEDWGHKQGYRDHYDLVTARAVAKLALLNEFCLPFVRVDGIFAAMKGSDPTEEIKEASYSLKQLKGKLNKVEKFTLPVEDAERHIIIVQKRTATPQKYPRSPGVAAKSPLI
ncbi:16S rRNA (guanine(527)-N(7))-methyltransferase RsmG [Paenibacillus crassostreae]|uniref:Ribosomal RNA small subunit methyltransferase G n=1 Tax=Paenibacillus crassostreae TaxID=1763538 RepID=A0A167BGJ5_9BACL|nr:16S rRNA (guanine(527)-N(7))-methyltransferase RsmG [Paenibacillus crassostreae]AOZ92860.1 16S rRNA (guanine(527)-N(7))-methyltransferase RsmG [Paenibacillus crassostreae]OAB72050.1 16S rRNA (guanine(527)-N(7))-methyltransferase RsmG [Paenibacillus crassostreae]